MSSIYPIHDPIVSLINTPFSRRENDEKREFLLCGRPIPVLTALSNNDIKSGKQFSRAFQSSWYQKYDWLCGSFYKQRLFCWSCLLMGLNKNVWTLDGYIDLKNLSRSAKLHCGSKEHIKNCLSLKIMSKNMCKIEDALLENARLSKMIHNEKVRKNRLLLSHLIDTTILLGKQELAFHDESDETEEPSNRGNFKEIFQCFVRRNPELSEHIKDIDSVFTGEAKSTENKLIHVIEEHIKNYISQEILDCDFFSVIVEDMTDIVEKSQCSITVRFVNKSGDITERFLGFFAVSEYTRAVGLFELLSSVLEPFSFENKLVAQSYDGAAVMSGELNCLQAKIKSVAPYALFTHCAAHELNLILQKSVANISCTKIFFNTLDGLSLFFHKSSKRTFFLDRILRENMPQACDTIRWFSKSEVLLFVASNYQNLINVFQDIVEDPCSNSESTLLAQGFKNNFEKFEFLFLVSVFKDVFLITDILYEFLQLTNLDVNMCKSQIEICCSRFQDLRKYEVFEQIFENIKNITGLPTNRKTSEEDIQKRYHLLYYEILDNIIFQLETRFADLEKLEFVGLLNATIFNSLDKEFPKNMIDSLAKLYPNKFDIERLKNELSVIYRDENFRSLKDCQEVLKYIINMDLSGIFDETKKLCNLVLTIPVTSASTERSFSCLKRTKSYLRSTMTQERLSALALFSIEKELLQSLQEKESFYDDIIDKFASLNDSRISLIYRV